MLQSTVVSEAKLTTLQIHSMAYLCKLSQGPFSVHNGLLHGGILRPSVVQMASMSLQERVVSIYDLQSIYSPICKLDTSTIINSHQSRTDEHMHVNLAAEPFH